MNTIPHITLEQATAIVGESLAADWVIPMNRMIDAANAVQESEYITAEQARELGAGKAEFQNEDGEWHVCEPYGSIQFPYSEKFYGGKKVIKYRAIKQDPLASLPDELIDPETKKELGEWIDSNQELPEHSPKELELAGKALQEWLDTGEDLYRGLYGRGASVPHAEQATVLRSDFDFIMQDKQRCVKLIEEVYTLLTDDKPIEAKELLQKRVNNLNVDIPPFIEPVEDDAGFLKRFKENVKADVDRSLAPEPHAELKAMYAQQVKDGTLDNFVWEYRHQETQMWYSIDAELGTFFPETFYRCTPKPTCQVRKQPELIPLDWAQDGLLNCQTNNGRLLKVEADSLYAETDSTWTCMHHLSKLKLATPTNANWRVYIQGETDLSRLKGVEIELLCFDATRKERIFKYHTSDEMPLMIKAYRITGLAKGYCYGGEK